MFNQFHKNPSVPFTDEEIRQLALDIQHGIVIAIDLRDVSDRQLAFVVPVGTEVGIHPKLQNLVLAAPYLYRELCAIYKKAEEMTDAIEAYNAMGQRMGHKGQWAFGMQLADTLNQIQKQIVSTTRIAINGPEKVAIELRKGVDR